MYWSTLLTAGKTVLVHDEQRERHFRPTAVVLGAELLWEMRRRVHRHRRTDQDLRVPSVLRDAAVQHFQRFVRPVGGAAVRLSGINFSVPAPEGGGRFKRPIVAWRRKSAVLPYVSLFFVDLYQFGGWQWPRPQFRAVTRQSQVRRTCHVILPRTTASRCRTLRGCSIHRGLRYRSKISLILMA